MAAFLMSHIFYTIGTRSVAEGRNLEKGDLENLVAFKTAVDNALHRLFPHGWPELFKDD